MDGADKRSKRQKRRDARRDPLDQMEHPCARCGRPVLLRFKFCRRCGGSFRPDVDVMQRRVPGSFGGGKKR